MANLKREKIELIKNIGEVNSGAEPEIEKVWTQPFITYGTSIESVSLLKEITDQDNDMSEEDRNDKAIDFLAEKAFGNKITKDDFYNRLPGPGFNNGMSGSEIIRHLLYFVADGEQTDDTKNFLAGKK